LGNLNMPASNANLRRLCCICARGGSKGVPNKNIRLLAGKPLIAHSILHAKEAQIFDVIAVSSDSTELLSLAKSWGADVIVNRPLELASDTAAKVPAILHCVKMAEEISGMKFDTITDLDATAPLRIKDILGAVTFLEESGADNVITGMPSRRSPYFNLVELDKNNRVKLSKSSKNMVIRRQDSPSCYDLNGSIYVWTRDALCLNSATALGDDTRLFIMPEERSIDIDTEIDFQFVEFLLTNSNLQKGC
jgi:CMP-N,N'-diacetyllegionaminic acid synthase